MKRVLIGSIALLAIVLASIIGTHKVEAPKEIIMQPNTTFTLTSSAFADGTAIPAKYTCKGENMSPPLSIGQPPEKTASLALILHDPDAPSGDFLHWTVWNISPGVNTIAENSVPADALTGMNGFGKIAYGGPCPPSGTHRYEFDLYALDTKVNLLAGASRSELLDAMKDQVLAQTKLTGLFSAQ
jgi:Raf kinase inhibitor-like YbhB/YbcL family protein